MYGNGLALMLGAGTIATLLIADPVSIGIGVGALVVLAGAVALLRIGMIRRARRTHIGGRTSVPFRGGR